MENNNFMVRAALAEDVDSHYLWFSGLPCASREIAKVTNNNNSKSIWCEVVLASENFIERYNRNPRTNHLSNDIPFVVINEWYRERLGITKTVKQTLKLKLLHGLYLLNNCLLHTRTRITQ